MRTLIVGEGKSGTTALLRSVSAALGEPPELFEPKDLSVADLSPPDLVVKKLLTVWREHEAPTLNRFDKRILIVRDPRDRLISHLLYDAYNRGSKLTATQQKQWLSVLRRKLDKPTTVPLVRLLEVWWQITRGDLLHAYTRSLQRTNGFWLHHRDILHTTTYERYVDGDFTALDEYLGVTLQPGLVRSTESRVERSGTSGDWRSWFTRVDVSVFRPMTTRWLRRYGYDHKNWELASPPVLPEDATIDYVRRMFAAAGDPRPAT